MSDVFISYRRKNIEFAKKLVAALLEKGREAWIDLDDINPTEEWWAAIKSGIDAAETFVFILSPDSLSSPVCTFELAYAIANQKRIIPVVYQDTAINTAFGNIAAVEPTGFLAEILGDDDLLTIARANWRKLEKMNWILCREEDDFNIAIDRLIRALDIDLERTRLHTRLLIRAREWEAKKHDESTLLVGTDLRDASSWLVSYGELPPQALNLQRAFIQASLDKEVRDAAERQRQIDELNTASQRAESAVLSANQATERAQRSRRFASITIFAAIMIGIIAGGLIVAANTAQRIASESAETAIAQELAANMRADAVSTEAAGTLTPVGATLAAGQTQIAAVTPTLNAIATLVQESENRFESLRLASASINNLNAIDRNAEIAVLLGIRALKTAYTQQADAALVQAVDALYTQRVFYGHTDTVTDVIFSNDGKTAFSSSSDNTIRLWDLQTGETLQIFAGDEDLLLSTIALSPDGHYILSGDIDGLIQLWDVTTNEITDVFAGHTSTVTDISFSPDGQTALSTSWDNTLRLWDVATGETLRVFEGHTSSVNSVAFSPDGLTALSASSDFTLRLWNIATGETLRVFEGSGGIIYAVAFSPDGLTAISGSIDQTMRLWDVATGGIVRTFVGHTSSVNSIAFSPDGLTAISGSLDQTMRLWDVETGETLRIFTGHMGAIWDVAISPDGQLVLSGSGGVFSDDNTVRLWYLTSSPRVFDAGGRIVSSVAFSPDGQTALSGIWDWTARLWNTTSTETLRIFNGHQFTVTSIVFSPDGRMALSGSTDDTLRLWDIETGETLHVFEGHTGDVNSVAFSPDGQTALSGSSDHTMRLWDISTGALLHIFTGHSDDIWSVAFSQNGQMVLSGSGNIESENGDNTMRLWDVSTGALLHIFIGHTHLVSSVAFSPDGQTALTGSWDRTMRLWDIMTGEALQVFTGHTDGINSVDFSPNGQTILSGGLDKTMRLWDIATGEMLRVFIGHSNALNGVAYSPDGTLALSGSGDTSPTQPRNNITMRLWDVDYRDFIDYACQRVFRDFNDQERQFYGLDDLPTCPQFDI